MSFHNNRATLDFHRQSVRGTVKDFVISFHEDQRDIEQVLRLTLDLFQQLMKTFNGKFVTGRLVAKVNFIHFNKETDENEERAFHFSSFKSENIKNETDFFKRHMTKIASRLESFNANGSNLLIKSIEHIHILLNVL